MSIHHPILTMVTKQKVLEEIERTAKENGGNPLGVARFEKETGIKPYDWHRYWARFGDALAEAGLTPNQLNVAHTDEFLIEKLIGLARKLGKFPTVNEFKLERSNDDNFPNQKAYERFGGKHKLARRVTEYCAGKADLADIVELCSGVNESAERPEQAEGNAAGGVRIGSVYLFKSGKYYKIGKTNDTVRRGNELRIQLPEQMDLIHAIETDDPSGVEGYWHRRFEAKRMNGEWFDLSPADIRAFRRWRRII